MKLRRRFPRVWTAVVHGGGTVERKLAKLVRKSVDNRDGGLVLAIAGRKLIELMSMRRRRPGAGGIVQG